MTDEPHKGILERWAEVRATLPAISNPDLRYVADLPQAPDELVAIIEEAMIEFGPDRHCDGSSEIAAIAFDWCKKHELDGYR